MPLSSLQSVKLICNKPGARPASPSVPIRLTLRWRGRSTAHAPQSLREVPNMAHQISGRAEIAYAGETPWHGLGVRVDGLQTAADMLRHAGLEWRVGLQPVCRQDGRPVEGFRFTVREDRDVILGVVTEQYQPIQNAQAAEVMDAP